MCCIRKNKAAVVNIYLGVIIVTATGRYERWNLGSFSRVGNWNSPLHCCIKMSSIVQCNDMKDAVLLFQSTNLQLYLKPIASLWISVQLPGGLEKLGKSVSTLEIVEKIKSSARPYEIMSMKVLKSMLEYVRFEAHLESRHQIPSVLERLDHSTVKLNNFSEPLKVRVCESKLIYPSRHDWDTFFHEKKNMNPLKPGERPDTVHFSMLPCSWFMSNIPSNGLLDSGSTKLKPSESVVRAVFEVFGPLRTIDIPMLDPYRSKIVPSSNTFAFGQDGFFEVYIQFYEYVGFVKCMAAFKGMKLLKKDCNNICTAIIQVDFDRNRHLSEYAIKDRRFARERIIQEEIDKERTDKLRQELEQEEKRHRILEESALQQKKLEEALAKKKVEEDARVTTEERKLVLVQRRLESLRLLEAILERVKHQVEEKVTNKKKLPKGKDKSLKKKEVKQKLKLQEKERSLRSRLLKKYHQVGEQLLEEQRERVRQTVKASALKLKSAVNVVPDSPKLLTGTEASLAMSQSSYSQKKSKEEGRINNSSGNRSLQSSQSRRSQNLNRISDCRNGKGSFPRSFYQQRSTSLNEKRYPPSYSFQPYRSGRGQRGRFEGSARLPRSELDQELWDGPEAADVQHSTSSRGDCKRVRFRGNDRGGYHHIHDNRIRDHHHKRNRLS